MFSCSMELSCFLAGLLLLIQELVNPLPDDKILDRSKLKKIADDIFKVHLKWKISAI